LLVGQVRTEMLALPGLVVFDVYRTLKQPPCFVVLHRWRQRADLERFLQVTAPRLSQQLVEVGATVERFTGILAAELPAEL
jgi:quinol monooxygenase YgiN